MDEKIESALARQLIPPPFTQERLDRIMKVCDSTGLIQGMRKMSHLYVETMLEQEYKCEWADVHVKREKNKVNISWKLTEVPKDPQDIAVTGYAHEIGLIPDPEELPGGVIVSGRGSGEVSLELEEGSAYYFFFPFLNSEMYENKSVGRNSELVQAVEFIVAIPLSDERKLLLRKAIKLDLNPEERVRHEFNTFLKKQDVFDEMREEGIRKIKAKGLSPDEEEQRIADFEDYTKNLKDRFGM